MIVTNYNYEEFVVDCLRSIAAQSLQPMECIVVDDCSTDGSVAAIEEFISSHEPDLNVQLVRRTENSGQMRAFMDGFERSRGSFVVFVDADDFLFPNFIETHLTAHLNTDYTAALSCSNEVIIDAGHRLLAGSIEKTIRPPGKTASLGPHTPIRVVAIEDWRDTWQLGDVISFHQSDQPLLYVAPDANDIREFLWSTTSGSMFRRGALDLVLQPEVEDLRICADFYLLHYAHLLGGTILIQTSHGFYRRHGRNNFAAAPTIGRGTRTWISPEGWNRAMVLRRIEDDVLRRFDTLVDLLGEPRMLQLLAAQVPPGRSWRVLKALRTRRSSAQLQYLALLAVKTVKKALLMLVQLRRFV